MIVSTGKSFLFGIVFDAGALLRENVLLAVPTPWFGQQPLPPRRALAGRRWPTDRRPAATGSA